MRNAILAVAVLGVAAGAAYGSVGSVISSFYMTDVTPPCAQGIFRDSSYVYGVLCSTSGPDYLRYYTTTGSVVGSLVLANCNQPRDADQSLLGTGYLDVLDRGTNQLHTYTVGGVWVRSVPMPINATAFAYSPAGAYYYVAQGGYVNVYATSGSFVNSFYAGGVINGLAATKVVNGKTGDYVVVGRGGGTQTITYVYTRAGSVVANFVLPMNGTEGGCCGPAAPAVWRETYWALQYNVTNMWAYQVDLGYAAAVAPASLGRLKALYR